MRRSLGGRERADHDAADDDHGHQQNHPGAAHLLLDAGARRRLTRERISAALGDDVDHRHQADREQDAGHHAGHEQSGDRYRAAGHVGVDDHGVGRWDDGAENGGRRGDDRGRKGDAVDLRQLAYQQRAQCARIGNRRARDCRQAGAGQYRDLRQAAGDAANEGIGELDHALGKSATQHELPRHHEQRNGHQRECIDGMHHALRQHVQIDAAEWHGHQRAEPEGKRKRHAEQADQKKGDCYRDAHSVGTGALAGTPSMVSRSKCSRE